MRQYMLMFSLGPVQTFIAQARKTRDLWLGSYLLSKLMEAAMEGIDDKAFVFPTKRIIFDSETGRDDIPDIPNKYIALFQTRSDAEAAVDRSRKQITDRTTDPITGRWEEIQTDVWKAIFEGKQVVTANTTAIWERQVNPDTLFEFFWVIVEGDQADYSKWLAETEKAFDARKRLRNFQVRDEQGEKSTISGEREALSGTGTDRTDLITFWKKLAADAKLSARDISHEGDERLDAIDVVKRFATKSDLIPKRPFPSTSLVATATFVEQLLTATIDPDTLQKWRDTTNRKEMVEQAEDAIWAIPYLGGMVTKPGVTEREWLLQRDGDLYFPETFVPRRLEKDYGITNASDAARIATNGGTALRELLRATDATGKITRPMPYYAMIQMDGDKMGTVLSDVEDEAEHKNISQALSTFSRTSVPKFVEERYPGRLIYAGGDDVFALAPLARDVNKEERLKDETISTVLELVDKLRQEYHSIVEKPVSTLKRKQAVTTSAGIAIAHHFTPLSYVRRVAKTSEELAKDHYGRNALVVTVIRRSGEQTRVGCHWQYDSIQDTYGQPIPLFSRFYELFKDDILSPKCVHILLEEADTLVGLEEKAQQSEIRRVLQRQFDKDKASELKSEDELALLAVHLVDLAEVMDSDQRDAEGKKRRMAVELHSDERRYGLIEVLGWLLVMAFLTRKDQE